MPIECECVFVTIEPFPKLCLAFFEQWSHVKKEKIWSKDIDGWNSGECQKQALSVMHWPSFTCHAVWQDRKRGTGKWRTVENAVKDSIGDNHVWKNSTCAMSGELLFVLSDCGIQCRFGISLWVWASHVMSERQKTQQTSAQICRERMIASFPRSKLIGLQFKIQPLT